ncbi:MAG: hypothetical protein ACC658_13310 [Acidimicrobiia bacterium]
MTNDALQTGNRGLGRASVPAGRFGDMATSLLSHSVTPGALLGVIASVRGRPKLGDQNEVITYD